MSLRELAGLDGSQVVFHSEHFGAVARRRQHGMARQHVAASRTDAFDARDRFVEVVPFAFLGGQQQYAAAIAFAEGERGLQGFAPCGRRLTAPLDPAPATGSEAGMRAS